MKKRSERKLNKLRGRFIRRNNREPSRFEIGRLIINASHITYRRHGRKGHWVRQKIREYLFNMNGIDYKKR